MMVFANMLENGDGVIADKDMARKYYFRAASLGCKEASKLLLRLNLQVPNANLNESMCTIC